MLKAVLLDIDGTLVNSNGVHAATWSAASKEFGYERDEAFFRPLIGMGGDRVLPLIDPKLSEESALGKSIASKRGDLFRSDHLPTLQATPGARALVERLHERGLRCVVASSTKAADLDALLAVADVKEFIDKSTTSDDADNSKPAPDIIAAALAKAGVRAEEAVMIGDTPYDVKASLAAGVAIVAVRCGGWNDEDLAGANEVYDDPADLLRHLESSCIGRALAAEKH